MAKPVMRRRWRKKRTGFGAAVGFLRECEQKKAGTARGSVTRFTMPLVQVGQGGVISVMSDTKLLRFVLWANFCVSD